MKTKKAFILGLIPAHFGIVICGAGHWRPVRNVPVIGNAFEWWGQLTGANTCFGFFAPSVSSPQRTTFLLSDAQGHTWNDVLHAGANQEVALRIDTLESNLRGLKDENRRELARSLAATMFARHPAAQRVVVRVEVQHLPTMQEFHQGAAATWIAVTEISFQKSARE